MNAETTSSPKISFILPAYNYEQFIGAAIESVLAQSDGAWELMIVNDCSTDRTLEVCQGYAAADVRIQLVDLPQNRGQYLIINEFAPQGRGEYSCVLDADDALVPDFVRRMYAYAHKHNCDVLLCQHRNISGGKKLDRMHYGADIPPAGLLANPANPLLLRLLRLEYFIIDCGTLVRRQLRATLGSLLPSIPMYAATDSMQGLYLAQHAQRIGCLQRPLYLYNQGSIGTWRNSSREFLHRKCYSAFFTLNTIYQLASQEPQLYALDLGRLAMVRSIRARLREGLGALAQAQRPAFLRQLADTVASYDLPTFFSAASLLDLAQGLPDEAPVAPESEKSSEKSSEKTGKKLWKLRLRSAAMLKMLKKYLPYGLVRCQQARQQDRLWGPAPTGYTIPLAPPVSDAVCSRADAKNTAEEACSVIEQLLHDYFGRHDLQGKGDMRMPGTTESNDLPLALRYHFSQLPLELRWALLKRLLAQREKQEQGETRPALWNALDLHQLWGDLLCEPAQRDGRYGLWRNCLWALQQVLPYGVVRALSAGGRNFCVYSRNRFAKP